MREATIQGKNYIKRGFEINKGLKKVKYLKEIYIKKKSYKRGKGIYKKKNKK